MQPQRPPFQTYQQQGGIPGQPGVMAGQPAGIIRQQRMAGIQVGIHYFGLVYWLIWQMLPKGIDSGPVQMGDHAYLISCTYLYLYLI